MATPPLLSLRAVQAGHDRPLFGPVDLALAPGDRMVLVGRNGAGKSTFLRLLCGEMAPDAGERWVQPGTRIGFLAQEPPRGGAGTAGDLAAREGAEAHRVTQLVHALGLDPEAPAASLSGGEARRAALAGVLATDPDVLLLDEPTNHLDLESIAWLEAELSRFKGALVVISHDRAFLRAVGTGMLWLDRGRLRRRDEGFERFERWAEEVAEAEAGEAARLSQQLKEEERYRERGVTGRRRRNQRRVEKLAALRAERKERQAARVGTVTLGADTAVPGGRLAIEADGIAKAYGGRVLFRDFSTRILRGDRVGIVGPNGAGKTTLLKCLIGEIAPDAGTVRLGAGVEIAHVDQTRAALDPALSLMRSIGEGSDHVEIGGNRRHVAGYLGDFLFDRDRLNAKVSTLSGGERNRLLIAKTLAKPANLLVLDEPTNDLDMETLDVLEAFLADWPGTLILVSHDRDFLDRTVGSVIGLTGRGGIREVVGGYSDWAREVAPAARERAGARPAEKAAPKPAAPRAKLSYKDARELAGLPERIAALEAEIAGLERELADPGLYARDPARVARAGEALEARRAALEEAETRWLELEEKREALAGARRG